MAQRACRIALLVFLLGVTVPEATADRVTPVVRAVRLVGPSVVNISTEQKLGREGSFSYFRDPLAEKLFRDFFGKFKPRSYQETSLGSGVIIDAGGYILTNEHVVLRSGRVKVTLQDGRVYQARVVGADTALDLAVLKIEGDEAFPVAPLGNSKDILIGETVIAIGSPFGLSNSVTTGVVSALHRTIRAGQDRIYVDFIQTDASINPGNSGGPLLNIEGEVIGINTAMHGQAQGIGFAIPIDSAKQIVEDLIRYGKVHYGWFGLRVKELGPRKKQSLHYDGPGGLYVSVVFPGSPAEKGGIREGDIVEKVGTHRVARLDAYKSVILGYTVGHEVEFHLSRGGEKLRRRVMPSGFPRAMVAPYAWTLLGLKTSPARKWELRALKLPEGKAMIIREVRKQGTAARIGIRPGDALLELDDKRIRDEEDYARAVAALRLKTSTVILLQRGLYRYYLSLPLP